MKKKIFFSILIVALLALAYFAYIIIAPRYFNSSRKIPNTQEIKNESPEQDSFSGNNAMFPENNGKKEEIKSDTENLKVTVSPADCDNECFQFKKSDELKYCQEVCGLSSGQPTDDCASKKGLEKDYCLKELAVKNKDFKTCDQIADSGIKKTCKDRVTEVIIENQ